MRIHIPASLALGLLALALPGVARAVEPDEGIFKIYSHGRATGTEHFYYELFGDSVLVTSSSRQIVFSEAGPESLQKSIMLFASQFDYDMRSYKSDQHLMGQKLIRGLVMGDTSFTSYRETNSGGTGDQLVRPPGRVFVHDPQVFVLFDVISRNLHTQKFETRPITLLVLGQQDTVLEVTAKRLPPELLTWGGKQLQAEKFELRDPANSLFIWADSRGRMLRLTQPASGLRVERAPPPVKARKPTPHGSG